jgi:hypothetical protein
VEVVCPRKDGVLPTSTTEDFQNPEDSAGTLMRVDNDVTDLQGEVFHGFS